MHQEWRSWLVKFIITNSCLQNIMLVVSYWAVWYNRNKLEHEGIKDNVGQVIRFIRAYIVEIKFLNQDFIVKPLPTKATWEPPKNHQFKINFDASLQ